ncbi:hypothetical protein ES702_06500 [subsurface metagenome]
MVYFQKFSITGVANTTVYDDGLESSRENPKRLLSIIVQVDTYQGNDIQGWWEREKIFDMLDYHLDTIEEGSTDKIAKSFNRLNEIEVGMDVPVGSTFKAAVKSGSTKCDLYGAYRYEIVT